MNTNVYIQLLDKEIDGVGRYTSGMSVRCHQHGELKAYNYDAAIPWWDLEELVDNHLHSMHFA